MNPQNPSIAPSRPKRSRRFLPPESQAKAMQEADSVASHFSTPAVSDAANSRREPQAQVRRLLGLAAAPPDEANLNTTQGH
jgi:hypothetical protein